MSGIRFAWRFRNVLLHLLSVLISFVKSCEYCYRKSPETLQRQMGTMLSVVFIQNMSIAHIEIVFLFLEIPNGAYTTLSQF